MKNPNFCLLILIFYISAKNTALSWNTNADKYTNNGGSITMGGLLIGFLSHNANTGVTAKPLIAGESYKGLIIL